MACFFNLELSAAQIQNIDIAMEEIVPNVLISNNVIANNPTTEARNYYFFLFKNY